MGSSMSFPSLSIVLNCFDGRNGIAVGSVCDCAASYKAIACDGIPRGIRLMVVFLIQS
jgi:hypothetical protein